MSVEDLTCNEVTEIIDGYLDGTMPEDERARLDAHLAQCEGCVNYLEQLRATIRLTGTLDVDGLPRGSRDALLEAFRSIRGR